MVNYQNAFGRVNNYENAPLNRFGRLRWPPAQNPLNSILSFGSPPKLGGSRTLTTQHIQWLEFKLEVGKALVGTYVSDEKSKKLKEEIVMIMDDSMAVEHSSINYEVGASNRNKNRDLNQVLKCLDFGYCILGYSPNSEATNHLFHLNLFLHVLKRITQRFGEGRKL